MLSPGIPFGILSQPTTLLKEMSITTLRCPLLNFELLERRIMKTLKASVYESYENMLNKTRSTSYYAHSYWTDSLSVNSCLNFTDDTGMPTTEQLSLDNDLIVYGCRLLIPTTMRHQVLTNLHEAHQGALGTKQRARLTIYWPGLDNDIDNILNCQQCQDRLSRNVKEPIIQKSQPARPFQEVAVDLCSYAGHDYLITVDCHTDWPDIIPMTHNSTASQITTALR